MRFLIDPGHGGEKPGAVYGGVREKDLTLRVALSCLDTLKELGHEAVATRTDDADLSLTARLEGVDAYHAHCLLSIHCNASGDGGPGPRGVETYYRTERSYPLANCLQQILATYSGGKDNGTHQDESRLGKKLTLLNHPLAPSALVELGYLSNPEDREYLSENTRFLGEVLAHGLDWYAHLLDQRTKENWPA